MGEKAKIKEVGIIGAGSFGTAIAKIVSYNTNVIIFSRREEVRSAINDARFYKGVSIPENIHATANLEELCNKCPLIFPIVPSENFRDMMKRLSPFLSPAHLLIHGTKGLDTASNTGSRICTMSQIILEESSVLRVGCLSGPNLSAELLAGQPAGTVIASPYKEVIRHGKSVLRTPQFQCFSTHDIMAAEIAGALKNIIAIGAGILSGLGWGHNIWALLVTRGLTEIVRLGKALGANTNSFFGVAGVGDLVATSASSKSRNFTFGKRLANGEKMENVKDNMEEVAEGVRTLKIMYDFAQKERIRVPIIQMIYHVCYEAYDVQKAVNYLMTYPYDVDVDFV